MGDVAFTGTADELREATAAFDAAVERKTVEDALQSMEGFVWCPKGCGSGGFLASACAADARHTTILRASS